MGRWIAQSEGRGRAHTNSAQARTHSRAPSQAVKIERAPIQFQSVISQGLLSQLKGWKANENPPKIPPKNKNPRSSVPCCTTERRHNRRRRSVQLTKTSSSTGNAKTEHALLKRHRHWARCTVVSLPLGPRLLFALNSGTASHRYRCPPLPVQLR